MPTPLRELGFTASALAVLTLRSGAKASAFGTPEDAAFASAIVGAVKYVTAPWKVRLARVVDLAGNSTAIGNQNSTAIGRRVLAENNTSARGTQVIANFTLGPLKVYDVWDGGGLVTLATG